MLNTRSLICAPTRETLRSWAATLEAMGSRTEQAQALPAAPLDVELVIAHLAKHEPIKLGPHSQAVLVIPQPDLASSVRLLAQPGVNAVLVGDYVDSRLLTYVAAKMLKGDVFGIAKVLPWGAQVHSVLVGSHEERLQALAAIDQYGRSLGLRGRHLEAIQLVADELLMNALYDAPAGAAGPTYAEVAPRDRSGLRLDRPAVVQVAGDGRRLAVGVRDGYGSLGRETVLATLERCLAQGGQVERKTSGAGVGLYMVANHVTELIVNLLPGSATEFICVFAVDSPGQQLKHFGIYEESFPLAAEGAGRERPVRPRARAKGGSWRQRAPRWQWAALAIAAVLLAATVVVALLPYLWRPATGSLRVSVTPKAAVYVNGVRRGVAAPVLVIPNLEVSSSYLVSAREPGYEPGEETVAVASGRTQEVRLQLKKKKAKAYVSSTPAGAEIWVDGKQTGFRTPALLENLEPDRRLELRLVRYGYLAVAGDVTPSADETLRHHTQLTMSPDFASVRVASTPSGARLFVNNVDTGATTPIEGHLLRGGQTYHLELRLEGRVPWTKAVTPKGSERLDEVAELQPGEMVTIQANVPARLSVGGVTRPLPFAQVLPLGTHQARLRGDRPYLDHSFVVTLKAGGKVNQTFKFGLVVAPPKLRILVGKVKVEKLALLPGPHKLTLVDPRTGETRAANPTVVAGEEISLE